MKRSRVGPMLIGMGLGLIATLFVVVAILVWNRDTAPRLTEEAYEEALKRWQAHGPADYDLDLELAGNRPGKVHVEVRDRHVTRMTRDGHEPSQKRTWEYWTVPGQFDTLEQELEMARDPKATFKSSAATQMVMWAEFDPQFGYPKRYDRVVLGTDFELHWKVVNFQPLTGKK